MINTVWLQLGISKEYLAILPRVQRTLLENTDNERQLKKYPLELAGRWEEIAALLAQLATITAEVVPV